MPTTSDGWPKSPARNPVVVKIPVPIMFDTTNAVALHIPSCRCRVGVEFWPIPDMVASFLVAWQAAPILP